MLAMSREFTLTALAVCSIAITVLAAQRPAVAPVPPVKDDGTVTTPSFDFPFSSFASQEARTAFAARLRAPAGPAPNTNAIDIATRRQMSDRGLKPAMDAYAAKYPYTSTKAKIGNVPVETFVPKSGIAPENKERILIQIHGGGFTSGGGGIGGAVETIPIMGIGRYKVIAVDYRLNPEHTNQEATDDVVSVYRDVLKAYKAENIGIYGCSAGGALTAYATAAFIRQKLPVPGAIGTFCASFRGFFNGDSGQLWPRFGSVIRTIPPADTKPQSDPLNPTDDELRKFPPVLFLTGTRAMDMSGAVQSHLDLHRLGVRSELLLFDGMDHGFFLYGSDLPESRQAHEFIARFFTENLGKAGKKN